jgi:S-adenosylmethionine:tRNA ribosyltransferase-isomerase
MLVLDRASGEVQHLGVGVLPSLLAAGDLLLLNDTRVIPARLYARRSSGRVFELLLLRQLDHRRWQSLLRPSAKVRPSEPLELSDGGAVIPVSSLGEGRWVVDSEPALDVERLEAIGETPLPPYIERPDGATSMDREAYQTVYARAPGAVAAPTAGLHFTVGMLEELGTRQVEVQTLTLHVGIGTFRPVTAEQVADHRMDAERYIVSAETAASVNRALAAGRRIVCVGTTAVRALEGGLEAGGGELAAGEASTELFITPGFRFRAVGAMLTNFHLPKSTLLMLVSAFAGRERILDTYREAVQLGYRFFSYGDCMLIL